MRVAAVLLCLVLAAVYAVPLKKDRIHAAVPEACPSSVTKTAHGVAVKVTGDHYVEVAGGLGRGLMKLQRERGEQRGAERCRDREGQRGREGRRERGREGERER